MGSAAEGSGRTPHKHSLVNPSVPPPCLAPRGWLFLDPGVNPSHSITPSPSLSSWGPILSPCGFASLVFSHQPTTLYVSAGLLSKVEATLNPPHPPFLQACRGAQGLCGTVA